MRTLKSIFCLLAVSLSTQLLALGQSDIEPLKELMWDKYAVSIGDLEFRDGLISSITSEVHFEGDIFEVVIIKIDADRCDVAVMYNEKDLQKARRDSCDPTVYLNSAHYQADSSSAWEKGKLVHSLKMHRKEGPSNLRCMQYLCDQETVDGRYARTVFQCIFYDFLPLVKLMQKRLTENFEALLKSDSLAAISIPHYPAKPGEAVGEYIDRLFSGDIAVECDKKQKEVLNLLIQ